VVAGAVGAHSLPDSSSLAVPVRIFSTGQLYHAIHSLALLAVATIMLVTENRRTGWSGMALQVAAIAFTIGIVCFSGGIYAQVANGFTSSGGIVPLGGVSFLAGWVAFAVGALGMERAG
jgi:uncharacterized membrane protein YgdD (TMEM256/DUF423 family)